MFAVRGRIQAALDQAASSKHTATLNSPYSFEVRPSGFRGGEPGDPRIVVERTAFSLKAAVVPDYLAVAVSTAIVAGAPDKSARH